jgi:Kef-type K+ transport system membrane component KefB
MSYGPEVMILLQITLILVFAFIFGGLMKRLHQPAVLGEILGGIILGPIKMYRNCRYEDLYLPEKG